MYSRAFHKEQGKQSAYSSCSIVAATEITRRSAASTAYGFQNSILPLLLLNPSGFPSHMSKFKVDAKAKAAQIGRLAVQSQMKLDEEKRKLLENRKAEELKLEQDMIQLSQAKLNCDTNSSPMVPKSLLLDSKCRSVPADMKTMVEKEKDEEHTSLLDPEPTTTADIILKSNDSQNVKHEKGKYSEVPNVTNAILPAPRKNVSVCVKFTPKSLSVNLPARESRDKVRLKEKKMTTSDTVDISEREPLFLQDKGDEFYLRSNFNSAINAYTAAVQKDPSLFLCFANRGACYLQMKQFQPCIEDCTAALNLLQEKKLEMPEEPHLISEALNENKVLLVTRLEESDENPFKVFAQESMKLLQDFILSKETTMHGWYILARRKVLVRRGLALCSLKELREAKQDYDEAFGLDLTEDFLAHTFDPID